MPLEIHLTEGPNVHGLDKDRVPLYVGHYDTDQGIEFIVLEGRKVGTPNSYRLHIPNNTDIEDIPPLDEAEITRFEYSRERTAVDFVFMGISGTLSISNNSCDGKYVHGNVEKKVYTTYNFFGDEKATAIHPSHWQDYFPK